MAAIWSTGEWSTAAAQPWTAPATAFLLKVSIPHRGLVGPHHPERMLRRLLGEDIDLKVETGADVGYVLIDPSVFEQVLKTRGRGDFAFVFSKAKSAKPVRYGREIS